MTSSFCLRSRARFRRRPSAPSYAMGTGRCASTPSCHPSLSFWQRSPRRRRELRRSRDSLCFLLPLLLTWLAGPASQPLCTRAKRYEWWRPWALRLRRHPPAVSFYSNSFIFQRPSNNFNFLTISPNEMILFALCSLKGNLTAHQR